VHYRDDHFIIDTPSATLHAAGTIDAAGDLVATLDGTRLTLTVVRHGNDLTLLFRGARHRLQLRDPANAAAGEAAAAGGLSAPMPGRVVAVHVAAGDRVRRGAALLVLEAMKMENHINAHRGGTVTSLEFEPGASVEAGAVLAHIEDASG
jgi:3-methylcrotonyl-CoA carboxylase alpha subunit